MTDLTSDFAAQIATAVDAEGDASSDRILARIGQVTRALRDSMRELGLDKQVGAAAQAVPDARDRLKYIATMTEQAAERALNAIEKAQRFRTRCSAMRSPSTSAGAHGIARRLLRVKQGNCSRRHIVSCKACRSAPRRPTRS